MVKVDFSQTPEQVMAFLEKELKITFNYQELQKEAHDKAFTAAKVTRMDLLNDIHTSLQTALKDGKHFNEWKKEIIPTLEKKGWWGEKDITNPVTGEIKKVNIDSRRIKTIFSTNMRVAYQKQRYEEMMQLPISTFWMYKSALLENTRDSHRRKHGTVLPRDHSFWNSNYPPNDWNCHCTVLAYSKGDLERKGLKVHEGEIEDIASPDWNYNVGKNTNLAGLKKINLDDSLSNLPLISSVKNKLSKELSEQELKDKFYKTLEVKEGDVFVDKTNDPILITDDFFKSLDKLKIFKKDRDYYITELAKTLINPDEIYMEFEKLKNPNEKYIDKDSRVVKKYLKYYTTEAGAKRALMVIVEYLKDKTVGLSAYYIDSSGTVENKRVEKLVYKKGLKRD